MARISFIFGTTKVFEVPLYHRHYWSNTGNSFPSRWPFALLCMLQANSLNAASAVYTA